MSLGTTSAVNIVNVCLSMSENEVQNFLSAMFSAPAWSRLLARYWRRCGAF